MTGRKVGPYLVASGIAGLLIFLAYLIFFVPQIQAAESFRGQTAAEKTTNAGLQSKVSVLNEKKKNLTLLKDQVDNLTTAFPSQVKEQDLFAAIIQAAGSTGVSITTLNPAAPVLGTDDLALSNAGSTGGTAAQVATTTPAPTAAAAAKTPAAVAGNAAGSEAGTAAGATPGAVTAATNPLSSIALIGMSITATGSQDQLRAFLASIEGLKRPLVVTAVEISAMEGGGSSMTIEGNTFLTKPLLEPTVPEAGTASSASEPEPAPSSSK
jgi:Tfp pilus assembly protein PilO